MASTALTSAGTPIDLQAEPCVGKLSENFETLESIDALYEVYRPRIFRFVLASVRDRDLAQTLTQDTFFRAWNARASFRGDCAIATWLTRIALNLVRDHTRTDRFRFWKKASIAAVDATELADTLAYPASSSEARLIAREQVALIAETVASLSERQRSVFLLRFVEELDLNEIAVITGLPVSTVKTHLYRGLAIIRERHGVSQPESGDAKPGSGAAQPRSGAAQPRSGAAQPRYKELS
jgi:RNA polymerase sigma-70 factor (ECF subfamily)